MRAVSNGILETGAATFLLLIAVRHFEAGPVAKSILAAGSSVGLLLSPLSVSIAVRLGLPVSLLCSRYALAGSVSFLLAALIPSQAFFIAFAVGGLASITAMVPLVTQMYQENYPAVERGKRFSRTIMIRIASAGAFSYAGGLFLSGSVQRYPIILLCFSVALLFSWYCLRLCPTRPLAKEGGAHPFRAARFVRQDPIFRTILISWMLMGMANLMMMPLRVEYLASPKYGLAFSAALISLFTGVIPNLSRFLMSSIWGTLFDRVNFFIVRAAINIGFALAILVFFSGMPKGWLAVAAVIQGISSAGGDIAWSLWVTKVAPSHRVADYMAVHTFMNGIRSAFGPFLGFGIIQVVPIRTLSRVSAAIILAATSLLVPYFKSPKGEKKRPPLSEPVPE